MTSIEKLEAAVAKLEAERAASTQGEWLLRWTVGLPTWPTILVEGHGPVVDTTDNAWYPPENADLIVTLHRTIDAQLALLRSALEFMDYASSPAWGPVGPGESILALADAILGGERS